MPTKKDKHVSPAGRKPIINQQVIEALVNYLMTGATQKDACILVGISEDTFYKWVRISEGLVSDGTHADLPKPPRKRKDETDTALAIRQHEYDEQIRLLSEFSGRIKTALASVRMAMVNTIFEAANPQYDKDGVLIRIGDWKAAATYLERRDPQEWARRSAGVNSDGSHSHVVKIMVINEDETPNG